MSKLSFGNLFYLFKLFILLIPLPGTAAIITGFEDGYSMTVQVVPRIGGFSPHGYAEDRNSDCTGIKAAAKYLTWKDYRKATHGDRPLLSYQLPDTDLEAAKSVGLPEWDILTVGNNTGACGYRARNVLISVTATREPANHTCVITLPDKLEHRIIPGGTANACLVYVTVLSNNDLPFQVEMTNTDTAQRYTFAGTIPEDVLIVSLGDSFASGEGNPDLPKSSGKQALWMDSRCHRSAYAGPFRAAVRLLNQHDAIANPRYRRAVAAGAVTVMSFACSGALVSQGLNGTYGGVKTYEKAVGAYLDSEDVVKHANFMAVGTPLAPQLEQMKTFLNNQSAFKKTSIDLLLLSGGGNDVQFGALVTAMVTRNIILDKNKATIEASLKGHFDFLNGAFKSFSENLNNFHLSNPALQTMIVNYPDPLYGPENKNCSGGVAPDKWYNTLFTTSGNLSLSEAEILYVREHVIGPLRASVTTYADTYHWLPVDTMSSASANVRAHGWCLKGAGQAYAPQERWFRTPPDSSQIQGNINGSFHPTYEFNDQVQGALIAEKFIAAVNAEPDWSAISITPSRQRGDVLLVPSVATITYPVGTGIAPTLVSPSLSGWQCEVTADGCRDDIQTQLGAHDASLTLNGGSGTNAYRRLYRRNDLLKLKVDNSPPLVECLTAGRASAVPCAALPWINAKTVTVRVTDRDAGVKSARISYTNPAPAGTPLVEKSDTVWERDIELAREGKYDFAVCAADHVGNQTGKPGDCDEHFSITLDHGAPAINGLLAHDIDWSQGGKAQHLPVVPVFGKGKLEVTVSVSPKLAPITCPEHPAPCRVAAVVADDYWIVTPNTFELVDQAGNRSTVQFATIRVNDHSNSIALRTRQQWIDAPISARLGTTLRAAFAIAPRLKELVKTNSPQVRQALRQVTDAQADNTAITTPARTVLANMQHPDLLVEWLNLLNGATYAGDTKAPRTVMSCLSRAGVNPDRIARLGWLHHRINCAIELAGTGPGDIALAHHGAR